MLTQNPEPLREIAPGTVVDGRYRVVRMIGHGGNGMVYEVEHARTGRKLALKALLDESGFARLEQEARAASMMKNGHTARIIDMEPSGRFGPEPGRGSPKSSGGILGAYMVMELLEGQSLRALLDDAAQLPLELTANIAMQICECLQEAHALGIIHRDLKPENVFLCASPWPGQYDVKVLDFGVMKIADDGGAIPKASLTRTGSTVGTPYYMSLEQLRNSSGVDARADVYSLGVVLYECLSGKKPFQAETIGDLVYALCSGPPPQLGRIRPDLPVEVSDLVMRTLSIKRDERPGSMSELALALVPHANPAFSLWLKVPGKQPAIPPPPPLAAPPLEPAASTRGGPPRPNPTGPLAPLPPVSGLPVLTAELPSVPEAPLAPLAPPIQPTVQMEPMEPAPSEVPTTPPQRNTPTAMFDAVTHDGAQQGVQEAARAMGGAEPRPAVEAQDRDSSPGDRDTPTQAIDLAALVARRKAAARDDEFELKTLNAKSSANGVFLPPDAPAPAGPPFVPTEQLSAAQVEQALVHAGLGPSAAPSPPSALVTVTKPEWQVKTDAALVAITRFVDRQAAAYKAAPPNTQTLVKVLAGLGALLVLSAIVLAKL